MDYAKLEGIFMLRVYSSHFIDGNTEIWRERGNAGTLFSNFIS